MLEHIFYSMAPLVISPLNNMNLTEKSKGAILNLTEFSRLNWEQKIKKLFLMTLRQGSRLHHHST